MISEPLKTAFDRALQSGGTVVLVAETDKATRLCRRLDL